MALSLLGATLFGPSCGREVAPPEESPSGVESTPTLVDVSNGWVVLLRLPSPGSAAAVACADVDGDGLSDVAIAGHGAGVQLYRGSRAAGLEYVWESPHRSETQGVAWGDLDGDGRLELAMAERDRMPNRVARWTGSTMEVVWTADTADDSKSVAWVDVDGDGDQDLLSANAGANRVHFNEGGVLGDSVLLPGAMETDVLAAWDVDGDGDLDLFEGNSGASGSPDRLLRNDAGSWTVMWTSDASHATNDAAWGDVDGDGSPELGLAHADHSDEVRRRQEGGLEVVWTHEAPMLNSTAVTWVDVDSDGDLDLALTALAGARLFLNENGVLALAWESGRVGKLQGQALCDIDGDGVVEWILSNEEGPHLVLGQPGVRREWSRGSEGPLGGLTKRPSQPPEPVLPPVEPLSRARFPCPVGMVAVAGGTWTLGEWDDSEILPGEWQKHTLRDRPWTVRDFCIAELPFPGVEGAQWPVDGLNVNMVAALHERMEPAGRRVCRIDELLVAAAGPSNWRYPYARSEREGEEDGGGNPCPKTDRDPPPLGSMRGCVSQLGVRDLQVRSAWGGTPPPVADQLARAGIDLAGLEGDFAVWGSTARTNTWYPPTNFAVHSHGPGQQAFQDDHVRLCADPGVPSAAAEARFVDDLERFAESNSMATWLGPAAANPRDD